MGAWLPSGFGGPYSDPWDVAAAEGAVVAIGIGIILALAIVGYDLGLLPRTVLSVAECIWWTYVLVFALLLAYNHWCRVRRPLYRTRPSQHHTDNNPNQSPHLADEVSRYKISACLCCNTIDEWTFEWEGFAQ